MRSGYPPDGVMMELVRLHHKPRDLPSEPLSAALLGAWQEGKYPSVGQD